MQFTGEECFRAGVERMRQARAIHDTGHGYALAMYSSALAVECMLRAFRWKQDKSFEGRHDLMELLRASDFYRIDEDDSRIKRLSEEKRQQASLLLRVAMNEVVTLWHNNLRYASEASLRASLKRGGRLRGVKGNALKKNSTDLLVAGQSVVSRGVALWISRKR
jgi:HEPN domain-containing protein